MKLISYYKEHEERDQLAILVNDVVYDTHLLDRRLPDNMAEFLYGEEENMILAKAYDAKIKAGQKIGALGKSVAKLPLLSPVVQPTSLRDAYAFRQHVAAGRQNRGLQMIPEFDQFPVFYFSNHNAIEGPGNIECLPDHLHGLDFELEMAAVIGKEGRNIRADEADEYIAGFMIMNDFSARALQMEEMRLNLGPAKGKDFATALGPYLVTPDELEVYRCEPTSGHTGAVYRLKMSCKVNGKTVSEGNAKDMSWTFAEIIERCSYGADLLPGDVIGSGTVGTGCFLELNGTAKRNNPDGYEEQWLQLDDVVQLEIEELGVLENTITPAEDDFSLLELKKD